jgi:TRAP-type C4-dicarboxylate transport system permease small subunit
MLERLETQALRATHAIALAACAALLVISLITFADVLLRWLVSKPILGFNDFAALATAAACAACFPTLIVRRGNLTVRFVGKMLGPRVAKALDIFGALVTAAFFCAMAWQYLRFTLEMMRGRERMPILGWLVWPPWSIVTVMIAVTALASILTLLLIASGRVSGEAVEEIL